MKALTVQLTFKKETKNSFQFEAEGAIQTLYIKKSAFPTTTPPPIIVITVKEA